MHLQALQQSLRESQGLRALNHRKGGCFFGSVSGPLILRHSHLALLPQARIAEKNSEPLGSQSLATLSAADADSFMGFPNTPKICTI